MIAKRAARLAEIFFSIQFSPKNTDPNSNIEIKIEFYNCLQTFDTKFAENLKYLYLMLV